MTEPQSQIETTIVRGGDGDRIFSSDYLAVEEPLELRIVWYDRGIPKRDSVAITMRTPGDDFELSVGFLHGEGLINSREDFVDIAYCVDEDGPQTFNIVTVTLSPDVPFDISRLSRHFYTTSSCGVCGKASLDALQFRGIVPIEDRTPVDPDLIVKLPAKLLDAQDAFRRTGGLHAAGLFSRDGALVDAREDVGRHNALDKLIGKQIMSGSDVLSRSILMLSGRASFELLQKAIVARIPVVAAVGAPSSLAVEVARAYHVTLLGFVRAGSYNIYSSQERIAAVASLRVQPYEASSEV